MVITAFTNVNGCLINVWLSVNPGVYFVLLRRTCEAMRQWFIREQFELGGELDRLVGSQHHSFLVVVLDGLVLSSSSQQGEDQVL